MEAIGSGSFLFVSSLSVLEVEITHDFGYKAAKAAVIAHTMKLAIMQTPRGARVNAIAPGSIVFPGSDWSTVKRDRPVIDESVRAAIPWGHLTTPDEVADAAIVMASAEDGSMSRRSI